MEVYIAPEVEAILALHPYLRDSAFRASTILDQLKMQADTLHRAHGSGDARVRMQLGSWWPQARGLSLDELLQASFGINDAQLTIAREYGFDDWSSVEDLAQLKLPEAFESALDDLLDGRLDALAAKLSARPRLATDKSVFGHQSTLLHYLGANGVESHRQQTPMNAPDLAQILIDHGARLDATANMYGGGQTPYDLASTSAHPYQAGISKELNRVLYAQA